MLRVYQVVFAGLPRALLEIRAQIALALQMGDERVIATRASGAFPSGGPGSRAGRELRARPESDVVWFEVLAGSRYQSWACHGLADGRDLAGLTVLQ